MQGIGTVAIDGPRFEEFLRSRKEFFEVSQGGLVRILLLGCTAGLFYEYVMCVSISAKDIQDLAKRTINTLTNRFNIPAEPTYSKLGTERDRRALNRMGARICCLVTYAARLLGILLVLLTFTAGIMLRRCVCPMVVLSDKAGPPEALVAWTFVGFGPQIDWQALGPSARNTCSQRPDVVHKDIYVQV